MKINNYIPAYRFQGYTDAWELRKLGEVIEQQIREVDKPNDAYRRLSVRSHAKGTFHQVVEDPSTVAMDKLYIVKADDLIVNITFAWEHAIAVANLYDDGLLVSHRFPTYRAKFNSDITYIKYLVSQEDFRRKLEFISPGGAGRNRVMNKKDFINLKAVFPTLPEQEAIGSFFSVLDQLITLHQRKLDTLKEQKKTYLKLLFPAKGQTKPALRFQGFEDDWEEVKLGEVLSVSKLKNKENEYSKLNVLSVSREQGTVNQIEYQGRSFASDDVSGYKIVNVGQMIYTKSPLKGAPYGIFQTVTINGIVSPLYAVYNSSGRALASFVSLILKEDAIATHYLSPLVTKGAKNTINVTDEGALEGKVKIPTLPEQQAIGTFFQTLDREISQVEDKLASLKELKKTLLRKLFV